MAKFICLCLLVYIFSVVHTKHIHPRSVVYVTDSAGSEVVAYRENEVPIDVIQNIKPSRFVPINSALFFINYPPCENGFERDVLGVCREVWE
ncbi:hypothetical protein K1T71_004052 [Dendrolimus kikuchii]|uniref:Uncharacterized protein n=1 Tax=Dendrolimus kikuchii TaxID=765133 RepID=A0ACC1D9Q3_9NEOP|nr:hypothetical protein K1T71_004052 [Dendrolimus kikuchii]